jgi:hypothetical protein
LFFAIGIYIATPSTSEYYSYGVAFLSLGCNLCGQLFIFGIMAISISIKQVSKITTLWHMTKACYILLTNYALLFTVRHLLVIFAFAPRDTWAHTFLFLFMDIFAVFAAYPFHVFYHTNKSKLSFHFQSLSLSFIEGRFTDFRRQNVLNSLQ